MKTEASSPLYGALTRKIPTEGKRLQICLIATFLFGLVAHGYGFLNFTINHDSLREFYLSVSVEVKLTAGRFVQSLLRYLMGEIMTLPWLTGLTGMLFVGLAVWQISKMFSLDSLWENLVLSGICVTNVTVTALVASYIHDFAGDMLALLLSVCAADQWQKMKTGFSWKATLLGAICLFGVLGIYQTYVGVTLTLICLDGLMYLTKGDSAWTVLKRFLRAAPMGLAAAAVYACCLYWLPRKLGFVVRDDIRNITNFVQAPLEFLQLIFREYRLVLEDLFLANHGESVQAVYNTRARLICGINGLFLISCLGILAAGIFRKRMQIGNGIFAFILLGILPLCMLCVNIFSSVDHNITRYTVNFFYLLVLLAFQYLRREKLLLLHSWYVPGVAGLILVILLSNVSIANVAYVRKDAQRQATLSTMTRVVDRLELYEDYEYGQSQVAIIGDLSQGAVPMKNGPVPNIAGLYHNSQISSYKKMIQYFDIVLQYPIDIIPQEEAEVLKSTETFQQMPAFPARGSIATIDGVVVVKLSN